jgi:DNA-binding NtrC family response regulator
MKQPLRVLVVDDEVLIADHLAFVIEEAGHAVIGLAASADEALEILANQRADLAILDIRLKGDRNGVDLAREMKAQGFRVPHIFISGSGDPETKAEAQATEPLAFIQKPFNSIGILSVIARVEGFEGDPHTAA